MISNYFLIALRNILKQKSYAVINILGLAIGLSAAILIFMYVKDELSFDKMHPQAENTYRIGYYMKFSNGEEQSFPASPGGWDNYLKDNYGSVTDNSSFQFYGMPTSLYYEEEDKVIMTEDIIWAEPNFGDLVYLPVKIGNPKTMLEKPNTMVMTESAAKEMFGDEDPINKTIAVSHIWATDSVKMEMQVTAIIEDLPSNSHMRPKYIANIFTLKPFNENMESRMSTLTEDLFFTNSFFVCNNEADIPTMKADLQEKINAAIAQAGVELTYEPIIRKVADVHFDKSMDWSIFHKSADRKYITVFITIAIMILLVACINYMNMATARSAQRAREVGLRKTFGSARGQLFSQFMMESFVLVLLSSLLAIVLVILVLPYFNSLAGKSFEISHLLDLNMLTIVSLVILFVTFVAGSYPALYISGFEPATVLKGKFVFNKSSNFFRKFLTVIQFAVSLALLISTVVVIRQMNLMRYSKLNEAGNQIVSVRYGGFNGPATVEKYQTFKNFLLEDPDIKNVTLANHLPRLDFFGPIAQQYQFPEVSEERYDWNQLSGDYDFPATFDLTLVAGRYFDNNNTADSNAYIINEAAVASLNLTPEEAIGQSMLIPLNTNFVRETSYENARSGKVIGVVKDFPYKSMYNKIEPMTISARPDNNDRIIHIKLGTSRLAEKIAGVEKKWKEVFPEYGFSHWFIDEEFGRMYENESRIANLTENFSMLAIIITCFGLYGLASFMSQQKTKEIGIRKALGASNGQVLTLLLLIFMKLLAIACLLAIPVAFIFSAQWLENFVYRTELSVWVFAGSIFIITFITVVTIGYETLKAAMTNPVNALKYE